MKAAQWNRIQNLFEELLALDGAARQRALGSKCDGDDELRKTLELMLASAEDDDGFLESPLEPAHQPSIPQIIDDFEIIEEVGRGGMGVVYRARQVSLRRDVAIKVLPNSWCQSKRTVERFHLEARSLARLQHPGIVTIFADGVANDVHYFAMEFIDGPNLAQVIRARREPPGAESSSALVEQAARLDQPIHVASIIAGAAEALQLIHDAKIVHRDIKPSNLFVTASGELKVGDFGLVLDDQDGRVSLSGELSGSPFYMSPEQTRGDSELVDARTDIYSLGVVLYELLTQERPFKGKNAVEIMRNVAEVEPRAVRSVAKNAPRDLAIICEVAMAKDPDDRFATAGELALDLRRAIALQPIHARPLPRLARAYRWAKRHRGAIVAGTLALLGSGLVAFAAIRSERRRFTAEAEVPWTIFVPPELEGPDAKLTFSMREMDHETSTIGAEVSVGHEPHAVTSPAGHYCLAVFVEGFAPMEFVRFVEEGQPIEPAWLKPQSLDRQHHDMARIDPVPVTYEPHNDIDPPLYGREVSISPYWIDKYEVSNRDYYEFVRENENQHPALWDLESYREEWDDLPVVGVSLAQATAYAEWRGKRLPTLAELLYAGRGPGGRRYPWTDAAQVEVYLGNCNVERKQFVGSTNVKAQLREIYLSSAKEVRSHEEAQSAFGVLHLLGNAKERSCTLQVNRRPNGLLECLPNAPLTMGSHWLAASYGHTLENSVSFQSEGPGQLYESVGFRCAVSVE